jgi:hypothetical protein
LLAGAIHFARGFDRRFGQQENVGQENGSADIFLSHIFLVRQAKLG